MATKKKGKKASKPAKAKKKIVTKKPAAKKAPSRKPAASAKPAPKGSAHNPWKAYAEQLATEMATTLKVMRAYPADQAAFQPHPRSGRAHQLFHTFGIEQEIALKAVKGTLTMPPNFPPPPATLAECISAFEKSAAAVVAAARAAKAEDHARTLPMFTGPGTMGQVPAGAIAGLMLADQIHHRGQLSVYLRMAGGNVPSIYGPSADEPW